MREFDELTAVADRLLGPQGCPWDKEQTFFSLQPYLLEEVYELIEAVDSKDGEKIAEELGDVYYSLVFFSKLGEKEGIFQFSEPLKKITEKLIRRHPHIFGDVEVKTSDEIISNWEKIKKEEFKERKSVLDGIPTKLPALARAQKIIQKIRRATKQKKESNLLSEEEWGEKFWEFLEIADAKGWNGEDVLRRTVQKKESEFRALETRSSS